MLRYIKVLCALLFAYCCCVNMATAQTNISGTWSGGSLSGSYKLTATTTLSKQITVASGKTLTINLNGNILKASLAQMINVENGGKLIIKDDNSTKPNKGNITPKGLWTQNNSGSVTLYGGVICNTYTDDSTNRKGISVSGTCEIEYANIVGCFAADIGAAVTITSTGKFTMNGGQISYNYTKSSSNRAGAVYGEPTNNNNGSKITISNTTLSYNKSEGYGGAICGYNVTLNKTKVLNNETTTHGGGIVVRGTKAVLSMTNNCEVSHNKAASHGGGIYIPNDEENQNVTLTISNTKINRNEAGNKHVGGGIAINTPNDQAQVSHCTISNSEINYNYSGSNGGGIYSKVSTDIGNSVIKGNRTMTSVTPESTGLGRGGGFHFSQASINTLHNTEVTDNACMYYGGGGQIDHGAKLTMTGNSKINNNESVLHGAGGLHLTSQAHFILESGEISHNKCHTVGGAIHTSYGCGLELKGGTISYNTANQRGGGVHINTGGDLVLNGTNIIGNEVHRGRNLQYAEVYIDSNGIRQVRNLQYNVNLDSKDLDSEGYLIYAGYGGGVLIDSGTCTMNRGVISGNKAAVGGGGIAFVMIRLPDDLKNFETLKVVNFTMNDGSIYSNESSGDGGGVYIMKNRVPEMLSGFADDKLAIVQAASNYQALYNGIASATISKGDLYSNVSNINGGALYLQAGNFSVGNVNIYSNKASADGGAIYVGSGTFTVNNDGSLILGGDSEAAGNNAINGYGGGVYCQGTFTANGSTTYKYNLAKYGGAVYVAGTYTSGNSATATISSNKATEDGGALYVQNGSVTLAQNTIRGNSATKNGGAIFVTGGGSGFTAMGASTITNNTAGSNGGALYLGSGNVSLMASTITGNSTTGTGDNGKGGAIYLNGGLTLGGDATISENAASGSGGAVYVQGGSITQTSGKITSSGNSSTGGDGGVFYVNGGSITLRENTMSSNSAKNGGVLYVNTGNISLGASNITGNEAKGDDGKGGAIYLNGGLTLSGDATISENAASGSGGAIYVQGGSITQSSGMMTSNNNQSTSGDGGVFYVNGGSINLGKTTMEQNSATNGGAIALFNGSFGFGQESNISHNAASGNGGGLYVVNNSNTQKTISCDGGSLTANTAGGNGGGLYVDGKINFNFASSLTADITDNTAANGGGIYIAGGADMTFGNGLIVRNAAGAYATESTEASGRGGGIYLSGGTLSFGSISSLGIYGNSAGLEAADIYSSGSSTTLKLPNVKDMNLTGFDVPGSTLYWVKDFSDGQGRYEAALVDLNVDIEAMILGFANGVATQAITNEMCLDLGYDLVYVGLEARNLVLYGVAEKSVVRMYYKRDNNMNLYRTAVIKGVTSGDNLVTKVGLPTGQWYFEIDDFSGTHDVTVTFANDTNILGANNMTSAVELNRTTVKPSGVTTPYNVVFSFKEKTWADSGTPGNPTHKPLNATSSVVNKMKW